VTTSTLPSAIDVVELVGDLDAGSAADIEHALAARIESGRGLVVDLSDCTFLDVRMLRALHSSYVRARDADAPFFVVLPFSASPELRFVMLHLASELVPYPIVPDRASAVLGLTRRARERLAAASRSARLRDLRARVWENGRTRERLLASRDILVLEQRETVRTRARSLRSRRPR
jgi:anti-anti-sigma regulatory factor